MLRAKRFAPALAVGCVAVSVAMSASAAASTTRGTLSTVEYKQLSAQYAAVDKEFNSSHFSYTRARAGCRKSGTSTALLRTERNACLTQLKLLEVLTNFRADQTNCGNQATAGLTTTGTTTTGTGTGTTTTGTSTGTTTTGTTTTPATSTTNELILRVLVCMNPRYRALGTDAEAAYAQDVRVDRTAIARGFRAKCLATLAAPAANLRKEKLFASSTEKLATDIAQLVKVAQKHASPTSLNLTQYQSDVNAFSRAATAFLNANAPQKLSVCPHAQG